MSPHPMCFRDCSVVLFELLLFLPPLPKFGIIQSIHKALVFSKKSESCFLLCNNHPPQLSILGVFIKFCFSKLTLVLGAINLNSNI